MCIFLLYSLPEQFLCPFWIEYLYILVRLGSTVCACLFHPSLRGVRVCDVSFPMECPRPHFGIKESWCFSCGLAGISWTASDGKMSTAIEGLTLWKSSPTWKLNKEKKCHKSMYSIISRGSLHLIPHFPFKWTYQRAVHLKPLIKGFSLRQKEKRDGNRRFNKLWP